MKKSKLSKTVAIIAAALITGIVLRLLVASLGHNPDYVGFQEIAEIMRTGGNVYAETSKYNYGPIWFYILHALDSIASVFTSSGIVFRYLLTGFLTLVDIGIFLLLLKKFGKIAAVLFFLNPVSILITGFHTQFDNLAVLAALISVLVYGEDFSKRFTRRKFFGLIILGASITVKHLFIAFPLWIALKQKGLTQKRLALVVPIGIFIISFLPFVGTGYQGIRTNVFLYQSVRNTPLLNSFLPDFLNQIIPGFLFFLTALGLLGFVFRKQPLLKSALLYLLILVIFSSSVLNQTLAIVAPAIAVFPNWIFAAYSFLSAYLVTLDNNSGMKVNWLVDSAPKQLLYKYSSTRIYEIPIVLLFLGFIWMLSAGKKYIYINKLHKWVVAEINYQRQNY